MIVGFYTSVLRKWCLSDEMFGDAIWQGNEGNEGNVDAIVDSTIDMMNWIFEYQSITTFINIPLYALI